MAVFGDDRLYVALLTGTGQLLLVDVTRKNIHPLDWLPSGKGFRLMTWTTNGVLAIANSHGDVYVYDTCDRRLLQQTAGNGLPLFDIEFSSDGEVVFVSGVRSGSFGGFVGILDIHKSP